MKSDNKITLLTLIHCVPKIKNININIAEEVNTLTAFCRELF